MLKRFLTDKRCFTEDQINIETNVELVNDEKILAEIFNDHFINKNSFTSSSGPTIGIRIIASEENYPHSPPVRMRVWVRIRVRNRFGGQFSSATIALETY